MKHLKYFTLLFVILIPGFLCSQTADKQQGCIPLKIQFGASAQSSYYWEFGDSASSDDQAPSHIYTNPGNYHARLYIDQSKSELVGEVEITVFPDVKIEIDSDLDFSCLDIPITFSSKVTLSSSVTVTEYLWTFGDGASADTKDVEHKYGDLGVYDVSLDVKTDFPDCDITLLVPEMVEIYDDQARFSLSKYVACSAPETFRIQNRSVNDCRLKYDWVIGTETRSGYDPGEFTVTQIGDTRIELTVSSAFGCSDSSFDQVSVLDGKMDIAVPQVTCPDQATKFSSQTVGRHSWDFGTAADPQRSYESNPEVIFNRPGTRLVSYSVNNNGCITDTTFQIQVDDKLADFTFDHRPLCGNSIPIRMTAKNAGMAKYYWNDEDISSSFDEELDLIFPVRDSFYVNEAELITLSLEVNSGFGCIVRHSDTITIQQPEAFFIPDSVIGFAPLTIEFLDASLSSDSIVSLTWDFDDGTIVKDDTTFLHTFVEPGKYYVQSEIETAAGCSDVSKGTFITALEPDTMVEMVEAEAAENVSVVYEFSV